jgi:hypothetical protein
MTTLLRTRKNEVFSVLARHGLSSQLHRFRWSESRGRCSLRCRDGSYTYAFDVGNVRNKFEVGYFPNANHKAGGAYDISWWRVIWHLRIWARAIAKELKAPDFWSDVSAAAAPFTQSDFEGGSPSDRFSNLEVARIRTAASGFRHALEERYSLSPATTKEIRDRLDDLSQAAEHQSRASWLHTAVGVAVSVAVAINPLAGTVSALVALFGTYLADAKILRMSATTTCLERSKRRA